MRTITHRGCPLAERSSSVAVDVVQQSRLRLVEGDDLFFAIHAALDAWGHGGGAFSLVAGGLSRLSIMTGGRGRDGMPMSFHGPHVMVAPLSVVAGAGVSGVDETGRRFIHCHAAFRDADARLVGGHLLPGETIVGADGLAVDLVAISGGQFAMRVDPETQFTVFHPVVA